MSKPVLLTDSGEHSYITKIDKDFNHMMVMLKKQQIHNPEQLSLIQYHQLIDSYKEKPSPKHKKR